MGLFGKSKKEKVVDLTPSYKRQQEKSAETTSASSSTNPSNLGFLGSLASSSNSSYPSVPEANSGYVNMSENEDKKRKLGTMLMDLTKRIEDLSNQIYHLKQRVELLEKKLKISFE